MVEWLASSSRWPMWHIRNNFDLCVRTICWGELTEKLSLRAAESQLGAVWQPTPSSMSATRYQESIRLQGLIEPPQTHPTCQLIFVSYPGSNTHLSKFSIPMISTSPALLNTLHWFWQAVHLIVWPHTQQPVPKCTCAQNRPRQVFLKTQHVEISCWQKVWLRCGVWPSLPFLQCFSAMQTKRSFLIEIQQQDKMPTLQLFSKWAEQGQKEQHRALQYRNIHWIIYSETYRILLKGSLLYSCPNRPGFHFQN